MPPIRFALFAAALAVSACHTAPEPLTVRETIPLDYRGSLAPAKPLPNGPDGTLTEPKEPPPDTRASDGAVTVRATLLELPIEEVRGMLSASHVDAEGNAQGVRVPREQMKARVASWNGEYPVIASPMLVVGYENCGSIRLTKRNAYVSQLTFKGTATQFMADPEVGTFEEGFELRVAPHRDGEGAKLTIEWRTIDRVAPIPLGKLELQAGRTAGIQLPLVLDQRIRAEVTSRLPQKGEPDEAILLGSTLTAQAGLARVLFLEIDQRPGAEATAALSAQ